MEGGRGGPSGPRDSEATQMPKRKGTFSRTRELKISAEKTKPLPLRNGKPPSSGSVLDTILSSSMQSPPTFLKTFDTIPKKTPNSMADKDPAYPAVFDPVINIYTDHSSPSYCNSRNATSETDHRIAVQGRRVDEEHMKRDLKTSNERDIAARTQRETPCEGFADTGLPAPEVSSSTTLGPMDHSASRSGCNAAATEPGKRRKQKSPEQVERARDRQRLARRAKRAAKACRSGEDHTASNENVICENSEEIDWNSTCQEGGDSSSAFSKLEDDELQRDLRLEMAALQASHESEFQKLRLQCVKEADENLGVISRVLRASGVRFVDDNQPRNFDAALGDIFYEPEHVAVRALKKLIAGSHDRVQVVNKRGLPMYEHDITCESHSL